MSSDQAVFHQCLYCTANALCRTMSQLAEETFAVTGLSPSHAILLQQAQHEPGLPQKELAARLYLAPSTVTRFVDELVRRGYLERRTEGRIARIYPTTAGAALEPTIAAAWQDLRQRYVAILGEEQSRELTRLMGEASAKLEAASHLS